MFYFSRSDEIRVRLPAFMLNSLLIVYNCTVLFWFFSQPKKKKQNKKPPENKTQAFAFQRFPTSVNKDCTPCPACYHSHSSLSRFLISALLLSSPSTYFVFQISAYHFSTENVNQRNCFTILSKATFKYWMIDNSPTPPQKTPHILLVYNAQWFSSRLRRQTLCLLWPLHFFKSVSHPFWPHTICNALILFPYRINCYTALPFLLIPHQTAIVCTVCKKCMFEYYSTFTLGDLVLAL